MKAKDIMTHEVITVRADATVDKIAQLLNDHHISGVPVVDEEGRVVGIVSESDLFLKPKGIPFSAVKLPTLFKHWVDPDKLAEIYVEAHHHTAADVMTQEVVCVKVDDEVGHIAWLMAERNLKRVPVLQDGILVGMITRADMIRMLARRES
jgi:CBS-domain-containing membrane protein